MLNFDGYIVYHSGYPLVFPPYINTPTASLTFRNNKIETRGAMGAQNSRIEAEDSDMKKVKEDTPALAAPSDDDEPDEW